VRTPAVVSLIPVLALVVALPAPALGAEKREPAPTDTPALAAEDFPALRPIAPLAQAGRRSSGSTESVDERVLIAATYWLLIGGLALRRVTRRAEEPPTPFSGWEFGPAPPLPR